MYDNTFLLIVVVLGAFLSTFGDERGYIIGNTAEWREDPQEEYVRHLTHLNLCFIRPQGLAGELYTGFSEKRIEKIVSMGHKHGVKMGIAFGGGGVYIDSTLMKDTTIRATLISNLMDFVEKYNFDGIDNDWEPTWDSDEQVKFKKNQDMKAYYGIFTKELRDSLDSRFGVGEKELSASIMNKNLIWYEDPDLMAKSNHFPLGFWDHLDFVSLMNYDDGVGSAHARYDAIFGADGSIAHWAEQGIPVEKMCVGLPFYGRAGWSADSWAAMTYKQILDSFPDLEPDTDVVSIDVGGGELSYGFNGRTTVKRKQLTADSLGLRGVMICFINFDMPVEHPMSLLGTLINYEAPIISSVGSSGRSCVQLHGNRLVAHSPIEGVSIYQPSGREVWHATMGAAFTAMTLPTLTSGIYIIEVTTKSGLFREIYSSR